MSKQKQTFYEKYGKRGVDIIGSAAALVAFSPILAATAIMVRRKHGKPILFTHERPGKDGKIFKVYKFRTMTNARDADGKLLPDGDRLTEFGKKLRRTSLDELPELFNVFKGDMSLVGPRPLEVYFLPYYTDEESHRHDVKTGTYRLGPDQRPQRVVVGAKIPVRSGLYPAHHISWRYQNPDRHSENGTRQEGRRRGGRRGAGRFQRRARTQMAGRREAADP